jgi:hypothetical protein
MNCRAKSLRSAPRRAFNEIKIYYTKNLFESHSVGEFKIVHESTLTIVSNSSVYDGYLRSGLLLKTVFYQVEC